MLFIFLPSFTIDTLFVQHIIKRLIMLLSKKRIKLIKAVQCKTDLKKSTQRYLASLLKTAIGGKLNSCPRCQSLLCQI